MAPNGGQVTLGQINFNGATYLEIVGTPWTGVTACNSSATCNITTTTDFFVQLTTSPVTTNDTLTNVNVAGGVFGLGGNNFTMRGGAMGPGVDYHPQIAPANGYNGQLLNWVFDGVYFHDWTRSNSSVHTECLQVAGGTNMTIRRSKFHNCSVFDLSFTTYNNAGPVTNITVENNWFDATYVDPCCGQGYFAINISQTAGGSFDFNSSMQAFVEQSQNTGTMTYTANVFGSGAILDGGNGVCIAQSGTAVYNYNITPGWKCGPNDSSGTPTFVNAAAFNLNLAAGSVALDFVPLSIPYPTTDIDGHSRPDGNANDAGASQAVLVNPPTGLTAVVQ